VIIQFRIEPLEVGPFATARQLLGDQVPIIEAIEAPHLTQQKVWPFYMSKIPGATWLEQEKQWQDEQQIVCMKSLGRLYAKCFMPGSSNEAVEKVIDHLRRIRALDEKDVSQYYELIDHLIRSAPQLRSLPLFYTHFDLNGMNILSDRPAKSRVLWTGRWPPCSPSALAVGISTTLRERSSTSNGKRDLPTTQWRGASGILCLKRLMQRFVGSSCQTLMLFKRAS
jgi:hypothetical protein